MVLHDRIPRQESADRGHTRKLKLTNIYLRTGAAAASLLFAILAVIQTGDRVPDDSYILLRYVQNLLNGHGWVYNLYHPTTNAVSSPLYTLVLALFALVTGNVETAMVALFIVTTALSGYLVFAILYKKSMLLAGAVAMLLMIFNPWLLATKGLETSAFVVLILLSVLLLNAEKNLELGFVLVAGTLVRGDGAVLAAVVFFSLSVREKRIPWRLLIGGVTASICWAAIAVTIGIPLVPDTLAAKYAQGRSGLWDGMLYLKGSLLTPEVFGFAGWATASLLLGGLGLLIILADQTLRSYLGSFLIATALIYVAYAFVIRPPSYHWYFGPQLALLALTGGVGVSYITDTVNSSFIKKNRLNSGPKIDGSPLPQGDKLWPSRLLAATMAIFLVMIPITTGLRETRSGPDRPEYLEASTWLRASTPQNATVALTEIGVVGWYSKREMVDFLGLLSKESVAELSKKDYVTWLSREEPDYWIVHQPRWSDMEAAAEEPWFPLAYRPVWGDGKLVAYAKYRSIGEAQRLLATGVPS